MNKYTITLIQDKVIEVEAESEDEALDAARLEESDSTGWEFANPIIELKE